MLSVAQYCRFPQSSARLRSLAVRTLAAGWRSATVLCVALILSGIGSVLGAEPVSKSRFGRVAIGGHDAAAYHRLMRDPQAQATQGSKAHVVDYKGAEWRFASAESASRFAANPEAYAPVYNGYCANALSLGEGLVKTDGTHWEIFGNELFLFYAAAGRERWVEGDWQRYRQDADAAWAKIVR